jgi:hypothetical protein
MDLYGWVTPKNDLVICDIFEHIEVIAEHEEAPEQVKQAASRLSDIEKQCSAAAASGDHPEWHIYDIARWGEEGDTRKALLDAGFIRLGQHLDRLHCHGRGKFLADKMQHLKDLAESYNCTAEFERQDA